MLPEKYIKDLESSRRRLRIFKYSFSVILFLTGYLLTGPLIHEASHILWLEFHSCFYDMDISFSILSGLKGRIDPGCNLNPSALVVFYSIGYLNTLIVGTFMDFYARATEEKNIYITSISLGILISVLTSVGIKGDLNSLGNVIGAPQSFGPVLSAFIILGIISLTYKTVQEFMD